jgi:hypothetical protein
MTEDEFARLKAGGGIKVTKRNGIWWGLVRPFFYRPLLPFEAYNPNIVKGAFSPFTGFQFALPEGVHSDSRFNLIIWDRIERYDLSSVSQHTRSKIRQALKHGVELRRITDQQPLLNEGYPIYLSFYDRTRYGYHADRCTRNGFEKWVQELFEHPKLVIIGGYCNGKLVSQYSSCRVGNVIVLLTAINSDEALKTHVPDLMIHKYREEMSRIPEIRFLFDSFFQGNQGVSTFKLRRGARVVSFPALLSLPIGMKAILQLCRKADYKKLIGNDAGPIESA